MHKCWLYYYGVSVLVSLSLHSQEKVSEVLGELERNLIAVCKEYMQNAKFNIVEV